MNLNKEQLFSFIRMLITAAGAYVFGHNLLGQKIDESLWQEVVGVLMLVISCAWSIATKCATVEMVEGTVRQIATFAGGLLVASGKLSATTLTTIIGLITTIIPWFLAGLSKHKNDLLHQGEITTSDLKK